MGFNFRIGTKLGIVGGVGLLMVGAIALNEMWDRQSRAELSAEAKRANTVRTSSLEAAVAIRRIVIAGRDIRLANAPADVDEALKRANNGASDASKALETGGAAAEDGGGRRSLMRASDVTKQFVAAVGEVAAARKDILDQQTRLGDMGLGWSKDMAS
jgi:hypothetical protein